MSTQLLGRSFLKLEDFEPGELSRLVDLALELKAAKKGRREERALRGRNVALVFEKTSTRTRAAFEVAAHDQGAAVSVLDPAGSQMGDKESVADTARVLGRLYDGIAYRGREQTVVEELAAHAGVPVWNALTDEYHPTQILADVMTMIEHCRRPLRELCLCYLGDARFNMGNSLAMGAAKWGFELRVGAPEPYWPAPQHRARCEAVAAETGARLRFSASAEEAVAGADFVYTDVWVSMGEDPAAWEKRIHDLLPFKVDRALLERSGNPEVKFLHCLPAFHDRKTRIGSEVASRFGLADLEVSDEVFESSASLVFDQAENRLHTTKALLVATLPAAEEQDVQR